MLKKYDKDGDGKLSEEEAKPCVTDMEAKRKALLEKYDANKNGKLDPEEIKAARDAGEEFHHDGPRPWWPWWPRRSWWQARPGRSWRKRPGWPTSRSRSGAPSGIIRSVRIVEERIQNPQAVFYGLRFFAVRTRPRQIPLFTSLMLLSSSQRAFLAAHSPRSLSRS